MSKFTKEELIRYSRQWRLEEIGIEGQTKIKNAKILVIGAGGLGCPILHYLCGMGVGALGVLDFDTVEVHNLHRQILYTTDDLKKPKAIQASERLKKINPNVTINTHNEMLTESNANLLISAYDIIVDGSDNFLTRYLVNDTCVKNNKPLVYGSIYNFEGQITIFNYKGSKNLRALFPEPPAPEDAPDCNENGVLGVVPGIIGTLMALETMKIILEKNIETDVLKIYSLLSADVMKLYY